MCVSRLSSENFIFDIKMGDFTMLNIFLKDTSAEPTIKGFLYQYLHTMNEWINIVENKSDSIIYCEYDDDIAIVNHDKVEFKQIKCYSKELNLSSDAIRKSIFNCFQIYLKYEDPCRIVNFHIVSNKKSEDDIVNNWETFKANDFKNYEEKTIIFIKDLVNKIIDGKKESSLNNSTYKIESSIKKHKDEVDLQYKELMGKVNSIDWIDFCKKIKFQFETIDNESLEMNILDKIKKQNLKVPDKLFFARLLQVIIEKSSVKEEFKKEISLNSFNNLLNESEEAIISKLKQNNNLFSTEVSSFINEQLASIKKDTKCTLEKTNDIIEILKNDVMSALKQIIDNKNYQQDIVSEPKINTSFNSNTENTIDGELTCDKLYEVVINRIDELIEIGKYPESKIIICKILDSKDCSDYSKKFIIDIKQRLGTIYINMGDDIEAEGILQELIDSPVKTIKGCRFIVTMAGIKSSEELLEIAISKMKELGESIESINLTLCRYYISQKNTDKAIEILTEDKKMKDCYIDNVNAFENLGIINLQTQDFDEAINCFKTANRLKEHWYRDYLRITAEANSILHRIGSLFLIREDQKEFLLSSYTRLCELQKHFEYIRFEEKISLFILKLSILLFTNPDKFYEEYCKLSDKIKETEHIRIIYADYLTIYKNEDALYIYQDVFKKRQDTELLLKILISLNNRKKFLEIITLLESHGYNNFDKDGRMADIYLEAIKEQNGVDSAIKKYEELISEYSERPFLHRAALSLYFETGNNEGISTVVNRLNLSIKDDNYLPRFIFSETLESIGRLNDSIQILKPMIDFSFKAKKRYIQLLLLAHDYDNEKQVQDIIDDLIMNKKADNEIWSIKADILFDKNHEESLLCYMKSFELKPSVVAANNIVVLGIDIKRLVGIDDVLEYLKKQVNPQCQMVLGNYYREVGQKNLSDYYYIKALSLLGNEFNERVYGQIIMTSFMEEDQNEKIEYEKIIDNSAAELVNDKESIWICINSEKDLISNEGMEFCGCSHYTTDSKEGISLRGKRVEDKIILNKVEYVIKQIVSRKAKIIRYCIEIFPIKCPDSPYLQTVNIPEDDAITPIIPLLVRQKNRQDFLLKQYNFENGVGLPLYTFIEKDNNKYIDAIVHLLSLNNQIFFAGEINAIDNSKTKVTFTYSSLLLLNYLKVLPFLDKIKSNIFIPKSLEQVVFQAYENYQIYDTRSIGSMTIGDNGKPIFMKLSEEEKRHNLEFWRELAIFVKELNVVNCKYSLDGGLLKSYIELAGNADVDCILLSNEIDSVLISDDLFIRKMTQTINPKNMNNNSIQILFENVDQTDILLNCLLVLSKGNYFFLYSPKLLVKLFKRLNQYPIVYGENTIWGKVKDVIKYSLSLHSLFRDYFPILVETYDILYDNVSFLSKDAYILLIIEEIKQANRAFKIPDNVIINAVKKRFGLNVLKADYFINFYNDC